MALAPQELPVKLGRQAHEWTNLMQWELGAVMTHDAPGECEHWVVGRQRQGVPNSLSGILRTEQILLKLKKQVKRMCCAQPSQLQLLTVR